MTLFDRIVATELPGIFNRAIAGWQQLARDGRFITVEDIEQARRELIQATSALADFIGEACEAMPGTATLLTEFFASFEQWATEHSVATGSRYALKRNLQQLGYTIKKRDGYFHVAGLKIGKLVEPNA